MHHKLIRKNNKGCENFLTVFSKDIKCAAGENFQILVPAAHGMGAPKASHGDRECESIVPRPRSPFVPFHFSEASVTFSFDLEDLVVSTQIVFLNLSSRSGQTPKFNPRSKRGGPHPTSIAQRASVHSSRERERYRGQTKILLRLSALVPGNAPSARKYSVELHVAWWDL